MMIVISVGKSNGMLLTICLAIVLELVHAEDFKNSLARQDVSVYTQKYQHIKCRKKMCGPDEFLSNDETYCIKWVTLGEACNSTRTQRANRICKIAFSACQNGICKCLEGFREDDNGHCRPQDITCPGDSSSSQPPPCAMTIDICYDFHCYLKYPSYNGRSCSSYERGKNLEETEYDDESSYVSGIDHPRNMTGANETDYEESFIPLNITSSVETDDGDYTDYSDEIESNQVLGGKAAGDLEAIPSTLGRIENDQTCFPTDDCGPIAPAEGTCGNSHYRSPFKKRKKRHANSKNPTDNDTIKMSPTQQSCSAGQFCYPYSAYRIQDCKLRLYGHCCNHFCPIGKPHPNATCDPDAKISCSDQEGYYCARSFANEQIAKNAKFLGREMDHLFARSCCPSHCPSGFIAEDNGHCTVRAGLGSGQQCSRDEQCPFSSICRDGLCSCRSKVEKSPISKVRSWYPMIFINGRFENRCLNEYARKDGKKGNLGQECIQTNDYQYCSQENTVCYDIPRPSGRCVCACGFEYDAHTHTCVNKKFTSQADNSRSKKYNV